MTAASGPTWASLHIDPAVAVMLAGSCWLYAAALRRAERATGRRLRLTHAVPFAAGQAALAIALLSALDPIGDRFLLSAHMLQHVLLADIAPALIVLGLRAPVLPLGLPRPALRVVARRGPAGRVLALLTHPAVALPLWALATWVWALPAVFDAAAASPSLHALEHATLLWTGLALWWLIVDPLPSDRRRPHIRRLAMLGFTRLASAAVCVPLTWLGTTLYPRYASAPRAYGLSALADQQAAGAAMCLVEFLVFGIAFAVVFIDVLSREERQDAMRERMAPHPDPPTSTT